MGMRLTQSVSVGAIPLPLFSPEWFRTGPFGWENLRRSVLPRRTADGDCTSIQDSGLRANGRSQGRRTEQRTGRTDRIGSKAARERSLRLTASGDSQLPEDQLPGLDIAMPYLAGTYDERMFERLRTRAQVFDILTGGDPTADLEMGAFWLDPDSEGEDDGTSFIPLPRQMLDDLRVDLAVRIDPCSDCHSKKT